jgi:hypothetical protein
MNSIERLTARERRRDVGGFAGCPSLNARRISGRRSCSIARAKASVNSPSLSQGGRYLYTDSSNGTIDTDDYFAFKGNQFGMLLGLGFHF